MKINETISKAAGLGLEKPDHNATQKSAQAQAGAPLSESVTLSPIAAQLQSLETSVASGNVYDAEKVAAIKSAIANGEFKVDAEKVADGLINTVKELLTSRKA